MGVLRRFLYLTAVAWGVGGLALIFYPHWILVSLFDQYPLPEFAGVRMAGIAALSLALLMVVIANHLEDAWWWAWAFVVATAGTAGVALLNAVFGLHALESSTFWWILFGVNAFFALGLLWGLAKTGTERPPV